MSLPYSQSSSLQKTQSPPSKLGIYKINSSDFDEKKKYFEKIGKIKLVYFVNEKFCFIFVDRQSCVVAKSVADVANNDEIRTIAKNLNSIIKTFCKIACFGILKPLRKKLSFNKTTEMREYQIDEREKADCVEDEDSDDGKVEVDEELCKKLSKFFNDHPDTYVLDADDESSSTNQQSQPPTQKTDDKDETLPRFNTSYDSSKFENIKRRKFDQIEENLEAYIRRCEEEKLQKEFNLKN